jgi:hypothetical protein
LGRIDLTFRNLHAWKIEWVRARERSAREDLIPPDYRARLATFLYRFVRRIAFSSRIGPHVLVGPDHEPPTGPTPEEHALRIHQPGVTDMAAGSPTAGAFKPRGWLRAASRASPCAAPESDSARTRVHPRDGLWCADWVWHGSCASVTWWQLVTAEKE